ncbi:MAG: DciA family protein [Planctomycetota bacterium]
MADPSRELLRICANRQRPQRTLGVTKLIERVEHNARKTEKRLGQLTALWESVVPPELAVHTRLVGLRGGTLDVIADSAPVRYELDRLLRGGGEHSLRRRYRGSLRSVRIRVGPIVQG